MSLSNPLPNHNEPPAEADGYLVENDALIRLGGGSLNKGRAALRLLLADEQHRTPHAGPVVKPGNVRLATIRDEPAILDLLLDDLAENATAVAPFSIKRLLEIITYATRARGGFAPVIDGPDGEPCAVAIVAPTQWWFSDDYFLSETVLYVAPEARRGHAGRDLLTFETWLAQEMGMFLLAGVTATHRARGKLRLYSRQLNPVGGFFIFPNIEGLSL